MEELKASVADHPHRQADGGVAAENLLHPGFHIELSHHLGQSWLSRFTRLVRSGGKNLLTP